MLERGAAGPAHRKPPDTAWIQIHLQARSSGSGGSPGRAIKARALMRGSELIGRSRCPNEDSVCAGGAGKGLDPGPICACSSLGKLNWAALAFLLNPTPLPPGWAGAEGGRALPGFCFQGKFHPGIHGEQGIRFPLLCFVIVRLINKPPSSP